MQNSLDQVIDYLEKFVKANMVEVNFIDFKKFGGISLDKKGVHIVFDIPDNLGEYGLNTDTVILDIEILDLLETNGDPDVRRRTVISDCRDIGSLLVSNLRIDRTQLKSVTAVNTIEKKYKDGLGGVSFTLTFNLQKTCLL